MGLASCPLTALQGRITYKTVLCRTCSSQCLSFLKDSSLVVSVMILLYLKYKTMKNICYPSTQGSITAYSDTSNLTTGYILWFIYTQVSPPNMLRTCSCNAISISRQRLQGSTYLVENAMLLPK